MNLTILEKDNLYDYIVDNKVKFVYKKSKIDKIKSLNEIILNKINISFNSIEDCFNYLTLHWDKKCKNVNCANDRKMIPFINRMEFNNCIEKYGIYKYCGSKCNYESISLRQKGDNNTCHRMTEESFNSMCLKNSIKMKENIRTGKFIPNVTNSWAKSRCDISFLRRNEIVNIKTRSSWEAYFQLCNPELLYEKLVIQYKFNGEYYNYIVDFMDKDNKILYEVKPDSEVNTPKNKAKARWARKWCKTNGYNFIIISNKWFKNNYNLDVIVGQPCEKKLTKNLKQFDENKKY